jgi:hypothetical protein
MDALDFCEHRKKLTVCQMSAKPYQELGFLQSEEATVCPGNHYLPTVKRHVRSTQRTLRHRAHRKILFR